VIAPTTKELFTMAKKTIVKAKSARRTATMKPGAGRRSERPTEAFSKQLALTAVDYARRIMITNKLATKIWVYVTPPGGQYVQVGSVNASSSTTIDLVPYLGNLVLYPVAFSYRRDGSQTFVTAGTPFGYDSTSVRKVCYTVNAVTGTISSPTYTT